MPAHCGRLSAHARELAEAIQRGGWDARACHQHAVQHFGADTMARAYLQVYEQVLAGESLHREHPVIQGRARDLPWDN